MSKEELFKKYQEIVLKTNGGADDYVVALCQISNLIKDYAEEKDQQIADLETKLAESEKKNKTLKDIRTLERVVPRNAQLNKLSNRDCYLKGFENAISETIRTFEETYGKEKCKLIEERDKYLMDIVKVGGYEYQIEELKQQLAEKDEEISEYIKIVDDLHKQLSDKCDFCDKTKDQDKISFAIEQLEKVEEILWNSQDIGNVIDNDKFLEKLNYLIKSLKGEK